MCVQVFLCTKFVRSSIILMTDPRSSFRLKVYWVLFRDDYPTIFLPFLAIPPMEWSSAVIACSKFWFYLKVIVSTGQKSFQISTNHRNRNLLDSPYVRAVSRKLAASLSVGSWFTIYRIFKPCRTAPHYECRSHFIHKSLSTCSIKQTLKPHQFWPKDHIITSSG